MSIRALFPTFFLMLTAGCVVKAQSPDAAPPPADSAPTPDTACTVDGPAWIGCSKPENLNEICDPVCQTGCNWCNSGKCTYGKEGAAYCGLKQTSLVTEVGKPCTVVQNKDNQIDNCAPGLVCLRPSDGDITSYCFRPCRNKIQDCPPGAGVYECDYRPLAPKLPPPYVSPPLYACNPSPTLKCNSNIKDICCDPTNNANCTGNQVCRLLDPDPLDRSSRTTCDLGTGGGTNKAPCDSNVDCASKYACISDEHGTSCRQICIPGAEKDTCISTPTSVQSCKKHGDQYGYCYP